MVVVVLFLFSWLSVSSESVGRTFIVSCCGCCCFEIAWGENLNSPLVSSSLSSSVSPPLFFFCCWCSNAFLPRFLEIHLQLSGIFSLHSIFVIFLGIAYTNSTFWSKHVTINAVFTSLSSKWMACFLFESSPFFLFSSLKVSGPISINSISVGLLQLRSCRSCCFSSPIFL
jgi:hypothetical protein